MSGIDHTMRPLELPANTDARPKGLPGKNLIEEEKEEEDDDDQQISADDLMKPDKPKKQRREVMAKPKVVTKPV